VKAARGDLVGMSRADQAADRKVGQGAGKKAVKVDRAEAKAARKVAPAKVDRAADKVGRKAAPAKVDRAADKVGRKVALAASVSRAEEVEGVSRADQVEEVRRADQAVRTGSNGKGRGGAFGAAVSRITDRTSNPPALGSDPLYMANDRNISALVHVLRGAPGITDWHPARGSAGFARLVR
jgi:hypothetical protein